MNTTHALTKSKEARLTALASPEARRVLALGREQGWPFAVLGQAPLPTRPVRLGDWLLSPIEQDSSPIPQRAIERVQALYLAGIRPQGFVLVHEAPLQLTAPARKPLDTKELARKLTSALEVTGKVVGGMAVAGAVAVSGLVTLISPLMLFIGAAMVDPILVAVTDDGYWIEIDRWYN